MPSAKRPDHQVTQVEDFESLVRESLDHAQTIKPTPTIEPPLTKSDFDPLLARIPDIFSSTAPDSSAGNKDTDKVRQNAVVETAARLVFSSLIASTSINSPEFVQVWHLLDLLSVLSDDEQCDPALLFWLVEELLDSQTVDGCRKVFDFLESRRERITSKNLKQKSLVILRSCNDLLRRLSRAEDAAFCGRVFIFMFQSIPPGDRSSVNLRGEYHVENVTSFENATTAPQDAAEKMDVDAEADAPKEDPKDAKSSTKSVSFDAKNKPAAEKTLDTDALYPMFWSLQHYFSQPTTLFDTAQLSKFKAGLEATITAFEAVDKLQKNPKAAEEGKIIPQKRKNTESDEDLRSSKNNPKYLTSRELFELEISDLYFRRHILIQAFIILDFLLSLTPQARAKLANITPQNRSVVYADKVLVEEDAKWAKGMKDRITTYIQAETDGYFFFRVIESVISRDKGWVRWKVENCPPIERPSVSPTEFNDARSSAKRIATSKKPRALLGSLPLGFMKEEEAGISMDKLKDPEKWRLPDLSVFHEKIERDNLDLEFPGSEKEKTELLESKASKTWRALRIARRSRLGRFDEVEDWQNIDPVFRDRPKGGEPKEESSSDGRRPQNRTPIIVSGPRGVGKSSLVSMLMDRQKGAFGKVIQHTTRSPKEGEVNGQDYHFVDSKEFDQILGQDYFLATVTHEGHEYGTHKNAVETMEEAGKLPIIELDTEATQSAKDNAFFARVIFISPPSLEVLEARLKAIEGLTEENIQDMLKIAQSDMENAKSGELYNTTIANDDLEAAYKSLEDFIYETTQETNGVNGNGTGAGEDIKMEDDTNDKDPSS
ncbi:THO complex subunit 1 transcription elongation factor-domain-containing protein [Xylariomycetidae sp. FL0641]|nr:THO complex subunit 1 transcription elongation factor-domain-containing protein [Xylariomycetidae sp. FL0641]